jgi:hypothetical protein
MSGRKNVRTIASNQIGDAISRSGLSWNPMKSADKKKEEQTGMQIFNNIKYKRAF